jgi:hypothetical protein
MITFNGLILIPSTLWGRPDPSPHQVLGVVLNVFIEDVVQIVVFSWRPCPVDGAGPAD